MPYWNGKSFTVEAHRIATTIHRLTGKTRLLPTDAVAGQLRTELRRLYSATGGKRPGTDKTDPTRYAPTSDELRKVYNGEATGAEIHALHRGGESKPEAPSEPSSEPSIVTDTGPDEKALAALKELLGGQKVDPEAVKAIAKGAVDARVGEVLSSMAALVADEVAKAVRAVEIKVAELPAVKVDAAHRDLEDVLRFVANRKHVMLKGPAGCGKTHMAEQIAKVLGLPYGFAGKTIDETKLLGYMDGGGTYRDTVFRRIWEFGGVFLADEMDAWAPEALIALNAPLSGNWCDFPDRMVEKHSDTIIIAAVNTDGTGSDRKYSAREVLDFASRNRFAFYEMDYDEDLELAISCNAEWTKYVQKVRAAIRKVGGIEHDVTPRDSIGGGEMLAAGLARPKVEEAYIWRGLAQDARNRILAELR